MPERLVNFRGLIYTLKHSFYALFIYLDLDFEVFKILIIFMCLDSLAGIIKVGSLNYRDLSLKRLIWGIVSKIGFLVLPLSVAFLGKGVGQDLGWGADIVMRLLIVSEFLSFIGNLYTAKTKEPVKEIDIFTMLYKSIRKSGMNFINASLRKIEGSGDCEVPRDVEKEEEREKE